MRLLLDVVALTSPRLTCNRLVAYFLAVMDDVFKALADPSRRKLLDVLHEQSGKTLNDLCEHLEMTRQAVTKHLNLLEGANLVATVWQGREKLHYLNPVPIHEIYERWIHKFERGRLQALSDLKKHLETPAPKSHGKTKVRLRHAHQHHPGETVGGAHQS
jgi:DNA-binding transcriptional ArsR family regulator